MQLISSSRKFLLKNRFWLFGIVIFILTIVALYYVDITYRVNHITVSVPQKNVVIAGLPAIEGKRMFLISQKHIEEIITSSNPRVQKVTAEKRYPDTIALSIQLYRDIAYLKSDEGFFLLGDEARVLGKSQSKIITRLPEITYYQSIPFTQYQAGTDLPMEDIKDALYFLQILQEMRISVNSIDIEGFHMLRLKTEHESYVFTSEKERQIQVYNLEQAIKKMKSDGLEYTSIDLRFDKPVITF